MSYIALARKWRPRTFATLVGQDHITKPIINSLNQQRLHHAYLFTGTRGVGKTSIARLLAKALNCEQGISSEPCLKCDACIAVEQGRFMDLIEIDGASRTRVEDTREILENVQYAPTAGRFKIYLIDEVHMLSQHSFNALLKTLEEPPAHVKFLLATSDPQKLPVTVLSRCLQFNLKHLNTDIIYQQLQHILDDEKMTYEATALELLAKAARGSMRDALSLLDQAIASCDTQLKTTDIKNILGFTQQDYALQLVQALAEMNLSKILMISQQISAESGHFRYVLDEMLSYFHQINLHQHLTHAQQLNGVIPEITLLSQQFSAEDTQLFYQIGLKGIEELSLAPTVAIGFEMVLLRMYTFRPAPLQSTPTLAYQSMGESSQVNESIITSKPEKEIGAVDHSSTEGLPPAARPLDSESLLDAQDFCPEIDRNESREQVAGRRDLNSQQPLSHEEVAGHVDLNHQQALTWREILTELKLSGLALNAAQNAEWVEKSDANFILRAAKAHQSVFTKAVIDRIEQALTNYYQEKIHVTIVYEDTVSSPAVHKKIEQEQQHQHAEEALKNDPFFQQLQHEFSAEIVKNSITPV